VETFLQTADETQQRSLIDPWELTGDLLFDPQTLLDTIMLKAGTMPPLINNVAHFYSMNRSWFNRHRITFQKWWEVIDDEYNPLWTNDSWVNISEHTDDDGTTASRHSDSMTSAHDDKNSYSSKDTSKDVTRTISKTRTDDHTTLDQNVGEVENLVSAFDATDYQKHDISKSRDGHTSNADGFANMASETETVHNGASVSGDANIGHASSDSEGTNDVVSKNTKKFEHIMHTYGNNSVMMTGQKLVLEEFKTRYFDIYDHMADIFIDEMCIRVYI